MSGHKPWSTIRDKIMADPERAARIKELKRQGDSFIQRMSEETQKLIGEVAEEDEKEQKVPCPTCNGRGWIVDHRIDKSVVDECPECEGNKFVTK